MVLKPVSRLLPLLLAIAGLALTTVPAAAHENHQQAEAEAPAVVPGAPAGAATGHEDTEAAPTPPMAERLLSWAGRMHPFAVHFPIALIPAGWIALVVARRRGGSSDLIRALVIFAGAATFVAALLGWLTAGFPLNDRPLLAVHRWTGVALGLIGAAIAAWAWYSSDLAGGRAMTWTLGLVTLLLLVQGWIGGAITHGLRHMMI